MVTHGGRCPYCEQRTTPGVGSRAGLWVCVPCKAVFDNYGHLNQALSDRQPPRPTRPTLGLPARERLWVVPGIARPAREV